MAIAETVLENIRERIVRYATSRGCRRPEAEDLAQETLILLLKYESRDLPQAELVPLAYKTFSYLLKNHLRLAVVRTPQVPAEDIPLPHRGESPEDSAIRGQAMDNLVRTVGLL